MSNKNLSSSFEPIEGATESATVIGLHSVKNLLGAEYQLSLFNENRVEDFSKTYGVKIKGRIDRFGIDLTDTQAKVMEGILRGLTITNYKGNTEPKDKAQLVNES